MSVVAIPTAEDGGNDGGGLGEIMSVGESNSCQVIFLSTVGLRGMFKPLALSSPAFGVMGAHRQITFPGWFFFGWRGEGGNHTYIKLIFRARGQHTMDGK